MFKLHSAPKYILEDRYTIRKQSDCDIDGRARITRLVCLAKSRWRYMGMGMCLVSKGTPPRGLRDDGEFPLPFWGHDQAFTWINHQWTRGGCQEFFVTGQGNCDQTVISQPSLGQSM